MTVKPTPEAEWMKRHKKCLRCQHEWFARRDGEPLMCPKCHSPYWNTPRKVK